MHVLITGAAGMLGRKLTQSLAKAGGLGGRQVEALTLVDVVVPEAPAGFSGKVSVRAADIAASSEGEAMIAARPDLIFHLAAIVSGEAEADFDKGYRINLDATRQLLDAVRASNARDGYKPRIVFASSIAVFGAPFPAKIGDDFFTTPLTSYGTQKAIDELLLADYSRKGFLDGVGIRLPTICIRPGRPNKAASGFFSNILREPLSAVGFLHRAATMALPALGWRRSLTMPGLSATVADQIAALTRVAGPKAAALIRRERDPQIESIVAGWARDFDACRATELGFRAETSFDEIIRAHIEDELGGRIA